MRLPVPVKFRLPESEMDVADTVPPDWLVAVVAVAALPVVFWFSVGTSPAWIAANAAFVPSERRYCPTV